MILWQICPQGSAKAKIEDTVKFRKLAPGLILFKGPFWGLIFGGAYVRRGLSTDGNLRFKIDWASLMIGSKFTVFALFYFVFEDKYKPPGGLYLEGRFNGGFFCVTGLGGLYLEGLIYGGAYFRNFTVTLACSITKEIAMEFLSREGGRLCFIVTCEVEENISH